MKSRLRFCLVLLIIFSFIACSKEVSKENGHGTGPGAGDFYATIDGSLWNADSLQLVLVSSDGVSINGLSKTGDQISMLLPVFKVGSYTLNAQSVSYALYANLLDSVANVYVSNSGTAGGAVTITSIDSVNHLVSGTFQLTLTNPADNSKKTITKGVFDYVPYTGDTGTTIIPPPTGGLKDTLLATIDGTKFFASDVEVTNDTTTGQLLIAGFSGKQDIGLFLPPAITAGTYNLDFATGLYIGIYNPDPSITLLSQSNGTVTIISNNTTTKRISGTFSFTATPMGSGQPANLTLGYFAVNY
jgi:Family of unknown function (DUF6252)